MDLNQQEKLIPTDQHIILVDNRNEMRLIKLSNHKKFNWRKTQINLEQLIKQPFYQLLEVGNNSLKPIPFEHEDQGSDNQQNEDIKDEQVKESNKEIYTLQQAQKLQADEIERLKKQKLPQELINELIQNNQQFQKRTAYSKAKYLKKKQKKYIFNFHAEPVCLQNLHDYYFKNQIKAIGGIRWDMMGLLLLHVGPIRKVLLSEKNKGILLGACLIKGAKSIDFVSLQQKNLKRFSIVEQLNISKEQTKKITFHTWETLRKNENKPTGFQSFILFGNYDFSSILDTVEDMKILSCQTSIGFFCLFLQPILQCYVKMRKNYRNYLNVKMYDSWCRQYQVLKNRTHPLMHMDSRSGYLLTAIRVSPR